MKELPESLPAAQEHKAADRQTGRIALRFLIAATALVVIAVSLVAGLRYLADDASHEPESFDSAYETAISAANDSVAENQASESDTLRGSSTRELSIKALRSAQSGMPEGVDLASLTDSLADVFATSTQALASISDADTARAAVSEIEAASARLDELESIIAQLPALAHGPVDAVVSNGMTIIKPLIDTVSAIPGVAELVQPVLGPMLVNLLELTD